MAARIVPGGGIKDRLARDRDWRAHLAPETAATAIADLARELISRAPRRAHLVGAAAAVPGIVRRQDGFVHLAPNLLWRDAPFGSLLSGHLPSPYGVMVANEADLGLWLKAPEGQQSAAPIWSTFRGTQELGLG